MGARDRIPSSNWTTASTAVGDDAREDDGDGEDDGAGGHGGAVARLRGGL